MSPPEPATLRWLLPPRDDRVTATEVATQADFAERAPAGRPYVALNMISTLDGKAAVAGRTGSIGDRADRQLFHALRAEADAVMVGAGTVRIERYGRIVRDPAVRARRAERGLAPDPLAVIVSGTLALPPDGPLLQDPESRVVIVTGSRSELEGARAQVDYLRGPEGGELDLGPVLARLRDDYGVRSVLCEGGPDLNASLFPAGLVDELFLSVAPKVAGGSAALTIVGGLPLPEPVELDLVWLLESEGHLFARYAVRREH